jgi:hypothetical protein
MIDPHDYGAVGNGEDDDAPALRAALEASWAAKLPIRLRAGKVYWVESEVVVEKSTTIYGVENTGNAPRASIRAGIPNMAGVLRLAGAQPADNALSAKYVLHHLDIDGNGYARDALTLAGAAESRFDSVHCGGAIRDGVHVSAADGAINANNLWMDCDFNLNGRLYCRPERMAEFLGPSTESPLLVSGQAVRTNGLSCVASDDPLWIIVLGDFSVASLRRGDPLRVGPPETGFYSMVYGLNEDTNSIRLANHPPPEWQWSEGADELVLCSGDGYHEERSGNNTLGLFLQCLARNNAGYGFAFDGLYGPQSKASRVEYIPTYGVRIGLSGEESVLYPDLWFYFERIGSKKPWLVRATLGASLAGMDHDYQGPPRHDIPAEQHHDPVEYLGAEDSVRGQYWNDKGRWPLGKGYGTGPAR